LLRRASVSITDLGGELGLAQQLPSGGVAVTVDDDANGVGWFVDPTPQDGAEFAAAGSPAAGRYDLFTVLLHEFGHALGFTASNAGFADHIETGADGTAWFLGADFTVALTADRD